VNSKLAKLEREIGSIADHIRGGTNHTETVVTVRSVIAGFFEFARKKLAIAVAFCGGQSLAFAASGRRLITIAIRPASLPRADKPKMATPVRRTVTSKKQPVGRAGAHEAFFVSICFGLLSICGVMIAVLFLKIRDMKVELAHWEQSLSATEARVSRVEKIAQQRITRESGIPNAQPKHIPITLGNDDMKVIRAFIKVLPSKPGAEQKIHVGEEISDTKAVPVPESLVNQIPKLRGARFLVDENGAIIIIGEGSNRADAVIEPQ
jgi:hypothetical protein